MKNSSPSSLKSRLVVSVMVLGFVAVLGVSSSQAQAITNTVSLDFPISISVFIPCTGDVVFASGNLHGVFHFSFEPTAGNFQLSAEFNPQDVSGVGLPSNTKYQGTGVTRFNFNSSSPPPLEFTFVNNFNFIGAGRGGNLLVHQTFHITIDANGNLTATVNNFNFSCK